ncbi:MAG TPA: IS110 family transposase [Actinomycetales bacterium]|nr:IS110 family transposase [Actinomycetales bacterium]
MKETQDGEQIIERVAALDIGKASLVCCARVPDPQRAGRRLQEVKTFSTMTRSLQVMADWLFDLGVTRVVMEATSDYWKPPFYLLEAHGFQTWLVNARDVKHLPGRPKTDRLDAVWLCKVAERQMLRASFVPPPAIRRLRDLTRYRADLVSDCTGEKNRVEKLLEDAQIKLSVVASNIFGVSGREMMAALITGQRDPDVLAQMARGRLRAKVPALAEALTGRFSGHHAYLLTRMLTRIDTLEADIADMDSRIEAEIAPFADAVARLDEIPGIGVVAARTIIAEVGMDMTRFPTAAHLASWARFAPTVKESAGRKRGNAKTGHGNRYLAGVLGTAAATAAKTDTFLGERYRRLARRRGKKRAVVAVGRSILTIVWHLLTEPDSRYQDLGPGYYESRRDPDRKKRTHIRELEALGYQVTLQPAA